MSIIEHKRYHSVKVAIKIFSMLFMRFLKQIDYAKNRLHKKFKFKKNYYAK